MVCLGEKGKVIPLAIGIAAVVLVGWIIQTLVSTARREGESKREVDQAREAQRKLYEATKADIDSRKRNDTYGGLLEDDGHKRD